MVNEKPKGITAVSVPDPVENYNWLGHWVSPVGNTGLGGALASVAIEAAR